MNAPSDPQTPDGQTPLPIGDVPSARDNASRRSEDQSNLCDDVDLPELKNANRPGDGAMSSQSVVCQADFDEASTDAPGRNAGEDRVSPVGKCPHKELPNNGTTHWGDHP
jgi:hypothetical protein